MKKNHRKKLRKIMETNEEKKMKNKIAKKLRKIPKKRRICNSFVNKKKEKSLSSVEKRP